MSSVCSQTLQLFLFESFPQKLPTHSTNTSNYVEASFRLTKDGQFNRTKAFNLSDLLDILLDDSVYYKKRLLDIGNGRFGAFTNSKSRYLLKKKINIREDQIFNIGENIFIVESEKSPEVFYRVDMSSGFCECKAGNNCGPCKHKRAISKHKGLAEFTVLPESDAKIRALYHYIADATVCKNSWYRDLNNPDQIEEISEFVEGRTEESEIVNEPAIESIENNDEIRGLSADESEECEDESSDDNGVMNQFITAMDEFKSKVTSAYGKTLKKGVKYFTKKLQKITKGNTSSLEKSLYSIGNEICKPKNSGKKRKMGKLIPIQVTAKSRRQYKHRGRAVGTLGRRPKDQEKRLQMVVEEEDENVYHSLPKQKKSKNKQIHSLKHSVDLNRPSAKKH